MPMKDSGNDSLSSLTDGYLNTLDTVRNSNVLDTRCKTSYSYGG
jgi:hypothetical protein